MRVLVIGGTGFIGRYVVADLLRAGHQIAVVHRGGRSHTLHGVVQFTVDREQLGDAAPQLRAFAPEVVVDMILSSGRQAEVLMNVFRGYTRRVVAVSSMDVYRACGVLHGTEPGPIEPLPLTESSAVRTTLQTYPAAQVEMLQRIFGWLDAEYDKIPVERAVLDDGGLQGTVLRLPMVYGPGDPLRRFHPVVKRILDGRRVVLFSDRMAQWRATKGYVEDVARAIALAATERQAAGRIYNVGEADTLTELEWAERIARAMEWDGVFMIRPDEDLPEHLRAPGNTAQTGSPIRVDYATIWDSGSRSIARLRSGGPSNGSAGRLQTAGTHTASITPPRTPQRRSESSSERPDGPERGADGPQRVPGHAAPFPPAARFALVRATVGEETERTLEDAVAGPSGSHLLARRTTQVPVH
jgi:nucleoside-diphosphate-sugar epimerase